MVRGRVPGRWSGAKNCDRPSAPPRVWLSGWHRLVWIRTFWATMDKVEPHGYGRVGLNLSRHREPHEVPGAAVSTAEAGDKGIRCVPMRRALRSATEGRRWCERSNHDTNQWESGSSRGGQREGSRRQPRRRGAGRGAARGGPAVPDASGTRSGFQQRRAPRRMAEPAAEAAARPAGIPRRRPGQGLPGMAGAGTRGRCHGGPSGPVRAGRRAGGAGREPGPPWWR